LGAALVASRLSTRISPHLSTCVTDLRLTQLAAKLNIFNLAQQQPDHNNSQTTATGPPPASA
jgi:hypothetical protein